MCSKMRYKLECESLELAARDRRLPWRGRVGSVQNVKRVAVFLRLYNEYYDLLIKE